MTLKVSLKLVIVIAVVRLPVWLCVLIVVPQDPKQWLDLADEERRPPGLKGTMRTTMSRNGSGKLVFLMKSNPSKQTKEIFSSGRLEFLLSSVSEGT